MVQKRNRDTTDLTKQKNKLGRIDSSQRRSENRTKIQLGGLILKSGLAALLKIEPGEDLQMDPHAMEKATLLLGGLIEAAERLTLDQKLDGPLLTEWKCRGEKSLRTKFLHIKNQATTLN